MNIKHSHYHHYLGYNDKISSEEIGFFSDCKLGMNYETFKALLPLMSLRADCCGFKFAAVRFDKEIGDYKVKVHYILKKKK